MQETANFWITAQVQLAADPPVCPFDCHSNGKCTAPGTCNCSAGWAGDSCEVVPWPTCN